MSGALQRIGRALDQPAAAPRKAAPGAAGRAAFDAIERTEAALRAWLAGRGGERPARASVLRALEEFQGEGQLRDRRQARLVSFGCVELGADGHRLIEDGERFVRLLGLLDGLGDLPLTPRELRRCYRGLVRGYFDYDPEPASAPAAPAVSATGRHNWLLLRDFLRRNVARMRLDGVVPRWVEALDEDPEMLTDDAGRRYMGSAASGAAGFERFRSVLDIAPASWLSRRVILAHIDVACRAGDRRFVDAIDALLATLAQYPPLVDAGLARILDRDRECHGARPHQRLFDFALRHWGNPWSPASDATWTPWTTVSAASRAMVTGWLKLTLIRQFFSLLGPEGSSDARRIDFWQQYHLQIDDLAIALGPTAAADPRAEIAALRERLGGRLFDLPASGSDGGDNALILSIGHHVIVEFGRAAGASHIFDRARLPFSRAPDATAPDSEGAAAWRALAPHAAGGASGPAGVSIDPVAAWGQFQVERLERRDTRTETWESRFEKFMRATVGVKPRPLADEPSSARR